MAWISLHGMTRTTVGEHTLAYAR